MRRMLLPLMSVALLLAACGEQQKIVTVLGPERIVQVPAKIDPKLTECMTVDLPSVDLIPVELPAAKVAAVLGVLMNRYKLGYDDCKAHLAAIAAGQTP